MVVLPLGIIIFIFANLLITLISRAISEELNCKGSEDLWLKERLSALNIHHEIEI